MTTSEQIRGTVRLTENRRHSWTTNTRRCDVVARLHKLGTVTERGDNFRVVRFDGSIVRATFYPKG